MFLKYGELPNVSEAWDRYGQRCRENLARWHAETPHPCDPEKEAKRGFARRRFDEAHAELWALYVSEWERVLLSKKYQA